MPLFEGTYLNNVVEADRGKLKQLIRPVRGFKTLKTAYATTMGFEVTRKPHAKHEGKANYLRGIACDGHTIVLS